MNRFGFFLLFSLLGYGALAQCNFSKGPEGELCSSAIYICGSELDGYKGKLPDKLSEPQPWLGLCNGNGTADNIIWFSFTVCSPKVCLEIIPSNCSTVPGMYSGIQAGLFTECNRSGSVACTDPATNNGFTSPVTLCYDKFTPGQIAYFFIDGYARSVCEFEINVLEGIDTSKVVYPPGIALEEGAITGPDKLSCNKLNVPVTYNLTPPQDTVVYGKSCSIPAGVDPSDSICYVWKVFPPAGRFFNNFDSLGRNVDIVFSQPGTYTISADAYFHPFFGGSCANAATGDILTWTVNVAGPDTIDLATEFVCPGSSTLFCGKTITSDGIYICQQDDCTFVRKEFVFKTTLVNDLGIVSICKGGVYSFQGRGYATPGAYQVPDASDCLLLHVFVLEFAEVDYTITSLITELTCATPQIVLTATGTASIPPIFKWFDDAGTLLGSFSSLPISKPGQYFLETSIATNSDACTSVSFIEITENKAVPSVQFTVPVVGCNGRKQNPTRPQVIATPSSGVPFVEWTLPDGKKTNTLAVSVDSALVAGGAPLWLRLIAVNGCELDTSVVVPTNFRQPVIQLTGDNLTCYAPKSTLTLSTDMALDSIRWSRILPKEVFYNSYGKDFLPVDMEGTYLVEAMARANSCWNVDSIEILDQTNRPAIQLPDPVRWHCNTDSVRLLPVSESGAGISYNWSTLDGKLGSPGDKPDMTILAPGFYILRVLNSENGCDSSVIIHVEKEQNIPTAIDVTLTDISCFGKSDGSLTVAEVTGGIGPYKFAANNTLFEGNSLFDLGPGAYEIEVRDAYDCRHSATYILADPLLFDVFASQTDWEVDYGEDISLQLLSNFSSSEIQSYIWRKEDGTVVFSGDDNWFFTAADNEVLIAEVETVKGCIDTISFRIKVNQELSLHFPNIFSPNGDGSNDILTFAKNKVPFTIDAWYIYDRLGNMVFSASSTDSQADGWDGMVNGSPVVPGVYVMVLRITDFKGTQLNLRRDVTVVR